MIAKTNLSRTGFERIGRPTAGTPAALGLAWDGRFWAYLGTEVGLYRAAVDPPGQFGAWQRLAGAPVGILSLAVSPDFQEDHTLAIGTNTGIYMSMDGGEVWQPGKLTRSESVVLSLAFSPDYRRDGILLAGTLEDGVLFSNSRGAHWEHKSFGLLDLGVFSLVVSPEFTRDGTVFAGTETALYTSYNQARAWKELPFPPDRAPILSLALVPDSSSGWLLLAGTESAGLFCSSDKGFTWQEINLPAVCINALSQFTKDGVYLAATNEGLFASGAQGGSWENRLSLSNILCLAVGEGLALAGAVDQGMFSSLDTHTWTPLPHPDSRALVGMALSPSFARDKTAFVFGPEEGVWKMVGSEEPWSRILDGSSAPGVRGLTLSPSFHTDSTLAVACEAGLLISRDGGAGFRMLADGPCRRAVFSPNGKFLAADCDGTGIRLTDDLGASWRPVPGPWDKGGEITNLAVSDTGQLQLAYLEGIGATLSLWQGKPGETSQVFSLPAPANPVVSLWLPAESAADRPWFVGVGEEIWKLSGRKESCPTGTGFPVQDGQVILSLTGAQTEEGITLWASTGKQLYSYTEGKSWRLVYDFGNDRAIQIAASQDFPRSRALYALYLGGAIYKGTV